jgi:hypothetical protein
MVRHLTFPLITQVRSIVTETADGTVPDRVAIEVRTSLGSGVLLMSPDAARDLAAKLATHVEAGGSAPK